MFTQRNNRVARTVGLSALVLGLVIVACGHLLSAATVAGAEEMAQVAPQPPATPRPAPVQAPAQVPPPTAGGPRTTPSATPDITQGLWLWQRNEMGDGSVVTVPDPSKYTVSFTPDGRLSVQANCNSAAGTYTRDGARLTLKLGPTTLVACPNDSLSPRFLRELEDVATFVFDGQQLVLNLRMDSGNMTFSAQPPASLTGSQWRVQGINNGVGGITTVLADTQLSATFGTDGRVSGNTGCNTFGGPYTVTGSGLRFGGLISTRRACLSDAANRQETLFLAALGNVSRYTLVGDMLTLTNAAGTPQVRLVRPSIQPVPGASPSPGPRSLAPDLEQPEDN